MRPALTQSLFKFNILDSSKLSLIRFYATKQNVESSQKKNYYDILKITPHATQNEVKSAYYKLTLQYHPDKNKSDYAKQKFQDVSEAYEVLSSLELRQNYDRSMMIRQQSMSTVQEPTSRYRDNVYSGMSKIYNFDAWTRAHYGEQMDLRNKRKQQYKQYKEEEERNASKKTQYGEICLFLLTITIFASFFREKPDKVK